MSWRELLQAQHSPTESLNETDDMAAQQAGAEADLREAYESHMDAQMLFWNTMTAFLGSRGRLMYEQPDFGLPRFSTGWMALEEPEADDHGETLPIPAIQVQTYEHDLIWKYFRGQAEHPGLKRRLFRPGTEELQQERTEQLRTTVSGHVNGWGYIDIKTAKVSLLDTREPETHRSAHGGIKGAYIPSVSLKTKQLPILPGCIPSNEWTCDAVTNAMRVHAPEPSEPELPSFYPKWGSDWYKKTLREKIDGYMEVRDREIQNLGEMVDILQTAVQVDFSVYDHFERLHAES